MRARNFVNGIGRFFDVMDSAIKVSNAVNNRRRPNAADLTKLGIDPERFGEINFR
ncbi:hypothetical protein [Chelativorans sp.]|uniref:hypothetical protein n=1 Tax=Chelativorans sp. TaxID=2203393 RepID=UPI00281147EB|nr:hypothetical protein [Chelativorans sp.]